MNLNRLYRPQTFEDVAGQSITVQILKKVIEQRSFKNVYLFAGKTGSGKTTCARIFAKAINNGIGAPIEMDATSMGVDEIRNISAEAYQRALVGEYKIYIIDECHSLGGGRVTGAWQALLKLIEEPPKYTIFIFCTTEPWKVPATVLNRMQRYNFSAIPASLIKNRLMYICEQQHFTNYEQSCDFISKISNGCMRDAITLLEQCADYSTDLNTKNTEAVLGSNSYESMFKLTWAIKDKKVADLLATIDKVYNSGADLKNFISNYLGFVLDLAKFRLFNDISITDIPEYLATNSNPVVQFTIKDFDVAELNKLADLVLELKTTLRNDDSYKSTITAYLLRALK